jgi:predicted nuclease with TOPRIM domain
MDDVTKLQSELKHITGLYERSESRVASLEEERARLETEAKELERSISRSIHEPSSSTSVHRQVQVQDYRMMSDVSVCCKRHRG